jgi:hypothetical protein
MGGQDVFAGGLAGRTTVDTDGFHGGSGEEDKKQKNVKRNALEVRRMM